LAPLPMPCMSVLGLRRLAKGNDQLVQTH
jgi:hypothetical protein